MRCLVEADLLPAHRSHRLARLRTDVIACIAGAVLGGLLGAPSVQAASAVRDDTGVEVRLSRPAQRIVTLAPSQAEIVVAAGGAARIVGVSSFTDDPDLPPNLPVIAAAGRVDLERVLQLAPDLVVAWQSGNRARDVERLRGLGIAVFASEPRRLSDIARLIRTIGTLLGTENDAERAAQAFDAQIAALRKAPERAVRTFVALWHQPLITINDHHLIADVVQSCGAINVFGELPLLAPRVSAEQLLTANPQLIIASGTDAEQVRIKQVFAPFQRVDAVRDRRIVIVDPTLFHRQSPRLVAGMREICAAIADAAG